MRDLVRLVPSPSLSTPTEAEFYTLVSRAPLDAIQKFFLRHTPCVFEQPDALEIDPCDGSACEARCLGCGKTATLAAADQPVDDAVRWWMVLAATMATWNHYLFFDDDGAFDVVRFRRCRAGFEATIIRCVMLADADCLDVTH